MKNRGLSRTAIAALVSLAIALLPRGTQSIEAADPAFSCSSVTEIPQPECGALVALYHNTDGENWIDNTGWLDTNSSCSWFGITCEGGHVTSIVLRNGLRGTLPPELENLTSLRWLQLPHNHLSGSIPIELGNLANLETLYLHGNLFSGSIPIQLGNLDNLGTLGLHSNQLTGGIPSWLGDMTSLHTIMLADNPLGGNIPHELGNLSTLRYLTLTSTQIEGSIPDEMRDLARLSFLALENNDLSGNIPDWLGNLSQISYLSLAHNNFSGSIPSQLGNLEYLNLFKVSGNQLSGSIPPELGRLERLDYLLLDSNRLTGEIPSELGDLSGLVRLILHSNKLTGEIPSELGQLGNLRQLRLDSNALQGEIPNAIASLENLSARWYHTDFGYNMLTSSDPEVLNFLDIKDPDWATTQTVSPANLQASAQSFTSVELTWTPILYTGDGGYYEASYATSPGGSYSNAGLTGDKYTSDLLVNDLEQGATYYFVVRTFTPAHGLQQNDLLSWFSDPVSVTTPTLNQVPIADANGPYTTDEGTPFNLDASGSSDPDNNIIVYEWDLDGDGQYVDATGVAPEVLFDDDFSGTIDLKVTDEYGDYDVDAADLTVLNLAPTVGLISVPLDPIQVESTIDTSASFTDPGVLDTHTAVWDWGDNSTSAGTVTESGGSGSVTGSHPYSMSGVYTITLTVSDGDGDSGESTFEYVVVYDPEGGFVTGGGWINSPEGAYTADPSLVGKATFGFVSKYKKGADVPTGQTQFQFKVADLNFHANVYEWLVVAGAGAQYKGVGTINREGMYKFIITGFDADINENDAHDVDRFRIKIWTEEAGNETVVYDNQPGDLDDADATTELGGGSIVIHKGN